MPSLRAVTAERDEFCEAAVLLPQILNTEGGREEYLFAWLARGDVYYICRDPSPPSTTTDAHTYVSPQGFDCNAILPLAVFKHV